MDKESAGIVQEASPIQEGASKGGFEYVVETIIAAGLATAK